MLCSLFMTTLPAEEICCNCRSQWYSQAMAFQGIHCCLHNLRVEVKRQPPNFGFVKVQFR